MGLLTLIASDLSSVFFILFNQVDQQPNQQSLDIKLDVFMFSLLICQSILILIDIGSSSKSSRSRSSIVFLMIGVDTIYLVDVLKAFNE